MRSTESFQTLAQPRRLIFNSCSQFVQFRWRPDKILGRSVVQTPRSRSCFRSCRDLTFAVMHFVLLSPTLSSPVFRPALHTLHWLPPSVAVSFESLMSRFKARHSFAPNHFSDVLIPHQPRRAFEVIKATFVGRPGAKGTNAVVTEPLCAAAPRFPAPFMHYHSPSYSKSKF